MKRVNIGIIGTGIIARAHAEGIRLETHAAVRALCDTDPAQMESFAQETGIVGADRFCDYREMIDSGIVNAIYVCTPTVSHCEIVCYAAEHGVSVFCEKPLAMNAREARMMLEAVECNRVVHMVGFAFRHIPAVDYIKDLVLGKKLGDIRHFRGHFFANRLADPEHPIEWRHLEELAGSGVTGDLICHVLDLAHYLGCDYNQIKQVESSGGIVIPKRSDPVTGRMREVTAEDTLTACLEMDCGTRLVLEGSRYSPFEMGFHIAGTRGSVKYNMMQYNEVEELFYDREGVYSQKFSQVYERHEIPAGYRVDKSVEGRFIRQCHSFVEAVRGREKCTCDFGDGLENQKILDKICESYKTRKIIR